MGLPECAMEMIYAYDSSLWLQQSAPTWLEILLYIILYIALSDSTSDSPNVHFKIT